MKKKTKLKFKEMNKKQKVVFVIDWALKGVLLALLCTILIVGFVSCFDKKEVTASADSGNASLRSSTVFSRPGSFNLDASLGLNNIAYQHYQGSGTPDSYNLLWIPCRNFPKITITFEFINYLSSDEYRFGLFNGSSIFYLSSPSGGYYTFHTNDHLDDFVFIVRSSLSSSVTIDYEFDLYIYAGEYSPGFGQGLAAGIEQGYQNGYNQGSADTAKDYALSMFSGSTAKFAYTNNAPKLSDFKSSLSLEYDGNIFYSDFPELTESYYWYSMIIDFETPFILREDSILFSFANALPLWDDGIVNRQIITISFNIGSIDGDTITNFSELDLYPVKDLENVYFVRDRSGTLFPSIGHSVSRLYISYHGTYSNFQSLRMTTKASSNSSYYAGYSEGYNHGYKAGDLASYQNGYNAGLSDGFQNGFNASGKGGFSWLISSVQEFLDTKFFGDFGIGTLVYVSLGITLVLFFLRVLAGG